MFYFDYVLTTRMTQLDYAEPKALIFFLFTPQRNKSDVGVMLVYMERQCLNQG